MYVSMSAAVKVLAQSRWNKRSCRMGDSLTCGGLWESLRNGFGTLVWWWLFMLKKRICCSNQRIDGNDWITGILCNATENDWTRCWHGLYCEETKNWQTWSRWPWKQGIRYSMFSLLREWNTRWNSSRECRRLSSGDYLVEICHKHYGYTTCGYERDTKTGLSYFSHHVAS